MAERKGKPEGQPELKINEKVLWNLPLSRLILKPNLKNNSLTGIILHERTMLLPEPWVIEWALQYKARDTSLWVAGEEKS